MTVRASRSPGDVDDRWVLGAWERGQFADPVNRAVILLAAAAGCSDEDAERVELGARDAFLGAELFRLAGAVVWSWVPCSGCGETLDVPVDLGALPRGAGADTGRPGVTVETPDGRLAVRLPDSRDLRAVADDSDGVVAGRRMLLRRLLLDPPTNQEITEETAEIIEAALEEASPGAAVSVTVACPGCDADTDAVLDVPLLLWCHVEAAATALMSEIHALASAYGWTETDVLGLPPSRRRGYLALVRR